MQSMRVRLGCSLFAVGLLAAVCGRAQDVGMVTLLKDTPLRVVRGVSVLQGIEGMHLRQGDFLVTGPSATAQVQLEFTGGAIVEVGPSSEVYLFSVTGSSQEIVLPAGWLKGEITSGSYRSSNPLVSVTTKGGNVLVHAGANTVDAFVEKGAAQVSGGSPPITSSNDKIFFSRKAGKPVTAAGRPSADFVGAMPISFRDELPSRKARFEGKKPPEPRIDHEVSFADVEPLLSLPANWRRGLVERLKPRLQDPAFRQAIEAHIASLPEWKPYLNSDNHASLAAPGKPILDRW